MHEGVKEDSPALQNVLRCGVMHVPLVEVAVPDRLWSNRQLSDTAPVAWCYLRAWRKERSQFTYTELRQALGLSHNTLKRDLDDLRDLGWILYEPHGLRSIRFQALWLDNRAFTVPLDLLVDTRIPARAKWVWALVRGREAFDYGLLQSLTGYSRNSLTKYIKLLRDHSWLLSEGYRVGPSKLFMDRPMNPIEEAGLAEVADFYEGLRRAKKQKDYSVGEYLMVCMVELLVEETVLIEHGKVRGLVNPFTGGRLHVDLLLPLSLLAMEFQGPQHHRPTDRFPSQSEFEEQQYRDEVKRRFCHRHGMGLIEVTAMDLSFTRLSELLRAHGVHLHPNPRRQRYLYEVIEAEAAKYRKSAATLEEGAAGRSQSTE